MLYSEFRVFSLILFRERSVEIKNLEQKTLTFTSAFASSSNKNWYKNAPNVKLGIYGSLNWHWKERFYLCYCHVTVTRSWMVFNGQTLQDWTDFLLYFSLPESISVSMFRWLTNPVDKNAPVRLHWPAVSHLSRVRSGRQGYNAKTSEYSESCLKT